MRLLYFSTAFAWVLFALLTLPPPVLAETPQRVAFFGILLIDTSLGGSVLEEHRRVTAMEARLVEAMMESGRYVFVDTASVAGKAGLYANLADCNGCDSSLAAELGADLALTGVVQKTSNLILSISIFIRDAGTRRLVGGGSADIRGNTDETWRRGIDYILRNRILRE